MSDTDDTDVLLLIPPDFFLLHTDSDDSHHEKSHDYCDPHCSVVDTLISQVHRLENRINKIEVNSEHSHFSSISSCNSTLIPMSEMSERPCRSEYHQSSDNYVPTSTKSTPQKPRHTFNVASLPSTPQSEKPGSHKYRRPPRYTNKLPPRIVRGSSVQTSIDNQSTDTSSVMSATPEKIDNKKMMGEIDQFLDSVKTIQIVSSQKSLEDTRPLRTQIKLNKPILTLGDLKSCNDEADRRFSKLNLKEVDQLLESMESEQKYMDLRDHQIESLYENQNFHKQQSYHCGDLIDSVPDLGYGMREIMYSENNLPVVQEQIIHNVQNERTDSTKSDSQTNSELTYKTVLENKSIVQNLPQTKSSPGLLNNTPVSNQSKPISNQTNSISNQSKPISNQSKPISNHSNSISNQSKSIHSQKQIAPKHPENVETDSSNEAYEMPKDNIDIVPNARKSLPTQFSNMTLQLSQPASSVSSINLFSLADIWNSNASQDLKISDREMKKLLPKLEEEKCRRKHCEKLIQELQMKILEMQQRLAVAVQVDSAKDEAILRFHEAWEKVANRWKSLESERNSLSQKLLNIEEKSSVHLAEAAQKVVQYEMEISKVLSHARTSKEKCNVLQTEQEGYLKKIAELQQELKTSQDGLKHLSREKEQLCNKITQLEKESLHDKRSLLEMQNEVAKNKSGILSCQNELSALKDDYGKLEKKIKDKQTTIYDLESQRNNFQISVDTMQKNETLLQHQIKSLQEETERAKHELRHFYQQQVEVLVKDKLKEFQEQLEQAEKSLQEELQTREQSIAKTAARQLQKLSEKHRLEVRLIEEKHKEEVRLYELQFNQMKQQISMLQNKLDSYNARRTNIAQELHNVMEQQWLEALRIINNSKSPLSNSPQQSVKNDSPREFNLMELRNILTSKENEIKKAVEQEARTAGTQQKSENDERYNVKFRSPNTVTDMQFRSLQNEVFETPISSKHKQELPVNTDSELQKYIKLLLDKMPKKSSEKPLKEERNTMPLSSQESSSSEFIDVSSSWPQIPKENEKSNVMISKENRSGKPPWK